MTTLMIVLRLLHIGGGVFWVGSAILNRFFLMPTVAATGDAGQAFLRHLVTQGRLTARLTAASYLTVLSGAALYWIDSQGFTSAWQVSGSGLGFALGGVAGLLGFGFGQVVGRSASLIGKLASQAQGAPTPDQAAALAKARARMSSASTTSTVFLIASLILMATARYWSV